MRRRKSYDPVLVQSFGNYEDARAAVMSLIEAGCTTSDISVVLAKGAGTIEVPPTVPDSDAPAFRTEKEGQADAFEEALFGGGKVEAPDLGVVLSGPLVSLLRGRRASHDRGQHLARALLELGVDKEEAEHYRKLSQAGEIIVVAAPQAVDDSPTTA